MCAQVCTLLAVTSRKRCATSSRFARVKVRAARAYRIHEICMKVVRALILHWPTSRAVSLGRCGCSFHFVSLQNTVLDSTRGITSEKSFHVPKIQKFKSCNISPISRAESIILVSKVILRFYRIRFWAQKRGVSCCTKSPYFSFFVNLRDFLEIFFKTTEISPK